MQILQLSDHNVANRSEDIVENTMQSGVGGISRIRGQLISRVLHRVQSKTIKPRTPLNQSINQRTGTDTHSLLRKTEKCESAKHQTKLISKMKSWAAVRREELITRKGSQKNEVHSRSER